MLPESRRDPTAAAAGRGATTTRGRDLPVYSSVAGVDRTLGRARWDDHMEEAIRGKAGKGKSAAKSKKAHKKQNDEDGTGRNDGKGKKAGK